MTTKDDDFRRHYTNLRLIGNKRERTSNSDDTTKPRVVFKATQVTKIGTEHPRMWHHVMAR